VSFCDQDNPDNRPTLLLNFDRTQGVLPNQPKPTQTQSKIIKEFVKNLPDELLVLFKQRYHEAKAFGEKNPKSYLVLEPGRYFNYFELSPRSEKYLNFSQDGGKYFAEDSYELDPRIDNRNVKLQFYPFELDTEKQASIFEYTYYFDEKQRGEEDQKLDAEKSDMLVAFNRAFPELYKVLKSRYKEAKKVGEELLESGSKMLAFEKKIKPNDPCSCGSGKKFKKCCANKLN